MGVELGPGSQGAGIGSIDDERAVEMVALVLPGPSGKATFDLGMLNTVAIEIADSDVDVADDVATDRHRQASLVDHDLFVIEWFDHGVDGDCLLYTSDAADE